MIKDEPKNVTDVLDLLYKICIRSRCFRERHLLKEPEHRCQGVGHMDSSPHRLSQTQCLSVSPPHPGSREVLPRVLQSPSNSQRAPSNLFQEIIPTIQKYQFLPCLKRIFCLAPITSAAYMDLIILLHILLNLFMSLPLTVIGNQLPRAESNAKGIKIQR